MVRAPAAEPLRAGAGFSSPAASIKYVSAAIVELAGSLTGARSLVGLRVDRFVERNDRFAFAAAPANDPSAPGARANQLEARSLAREIGDVIDRQPRAELRRRVAATDDAFYDSNDDWPASSS